MRSGFRKAELQEVPGGETSAWATTGADAGGTATSVEVSPATRMSACGLAALVIVATPSNSASQSYPGIDVRVAVSASATDSPLP